jgi:two-component system NtrC family sensor kinase
LDRKEALAIACSVLQSNGQHEAAAELRRAVTALDAYEAHDRTISAVTRSLLESEKTFRLVFSHELDPMSLFDHVTGSFLDVNESWVSLYGYSRDEALAMKVVDVSAEPAQTKSAIAGMAVNEATRVDVRWHRAKDGTVFPVELTAGKLVIDGREVTYAVMRDITQRHRAERALARSEASYRALIESMPDGVVVHRQGMTVYMSPSARRMLGYSLDEDVTHTPTLEMVHPDDRAGVIERIRLIHTSGAAAPLVEERLLRRDGSHVVAEIAARKEIESQLVMNDRLASLGRLAASVGHELNNPLAYVLGNVGFMERELSRADDVPEPFVERFRTYVTVVGEGARRMRDIVHDLKTLARGDDGGPSTIDVQHLLDVCANMAEHELRPRTKLVKYYRDPVTVFGAETRLGQVFLNLLVNAGQAIPEGHADANEVRLVVRAEGEHAVVEISDTGTGIPREQIDRIFEPFFTTKEGVGTGLGLSISHRIVAAAGGTLTCEPRAGGGTTFRVTLPSAGIIHRQPQFAE